MADPKTRYERGLDVLTTLGGSEEAGRGMAAFFENQGALGSVVLHTAVGEIWSRSELSRRDRSLVVISFLTAMARELELRQHVSGGLNHGLSREEIDEIMLQVSVYAGVPVALAGTGLASAVFAERDGTEQRTPPPAPAELQDDARRRADGLDVLRGMLGMPDDADMGGVASQITEQLGEMGRLVIDFAFGDVWSRPQLSRRDRSLVVISVLTALSLSHELEIHLGGALNHGVTKTEIEEVMLTMVVYGGFPRAIDGMHLAIKVFAAREPS
jgi:4-carboxymuconolactone decarboxylase